MTFFAVLQRIIESSLPLDMAWTPKEQKQPITAANTQLSVSAQSMQGRAGYLRQQSSYGNRVDGPTVPPIFGSGEVRSKWQLAITQRIVESLAMKRKSKRVNIDRQPRQGETKGKG
jgi:hypothetical protein